MYYDVIILLLTIITISFSIIAINIFVKFIAIIKTKQKNNITPKTIQEIPFEDFIYSLSLLDSGFFYLSLNHKQSGCTKKLAVMLGLETGENANLQEFINAFSNDYQLELRERIRNLEEKNIAFEMIIPPSLSNYDNKFQDISFLVVAKKVLINTQSQIILISIQEIDNFNSKVSQLLPIKNIIQDFKIQQNILEEIPLEAWQYDNNLNLTYSTLDEELPDRIKELMQLSVQNNTTINEKFNNGISESFELQLIPQNKNQYIGYILNNSNSYKLQTQLDKLKEFYHNILEEIPLATLIISYEQEIIYSNKLFRELFCLKQEDIDGINSYELLLRYFRAQRTIAYSDDFNSFLYKELNKLSVKYKETLHKFTGTLDFIDGRNLSVDYIPVNNNFWILTYTDITETNMQKYEYTQSTQTKKIIIDKIKEGIFILQHSGRIQDFNKICCSILEMDQEYLSSKPHIIEVFSKLEQHIVPASRPDKESFIGSLLSNQEINGTLEFTNNKIIAYRSATLPGSYTLLMFEDISTQKQINKALSLKDDSIKISNKQIANFIKGMSYELNNPLHTINGYAQIVKSQRYGEINQRQTKYITEIINSTKQIKQTINNLLDISTIEADEITPQFTQINIVEVINHAISMLNSILNNSEYRIIYDNNKENIFFKSESNLLTNLILHTLLFINEHSENNDTKIKSIIKKSQLIISIHCNMTISQNEAKLLNNTPQDDNDEIIYGITLLKKYTRTLNGTLTANKTKNNTTFIYSFTSPQ